MPSLLLGALWAGCATTPGTTEPSPTPTPEVGWQPDAVHRGTGEVLRAGAAALSISPTRYETFDDLDGDGRWDGDEPWLDCGVDRLCPGDEGYPGPDEGEGDGVQQAVYLAGFGQDRAMLGVHDDIWARALVLEQGEVRIGLVALDVVGFFLEQVELIEATVAAELELDDLIVVSTHNHEGPDTLGIWGPNLVTTGRDPAYFQQIRDQVGAALRQATGALTEAALTVARTRVEDEDWGGQGINNFNVDSRDPAIVDPWIAALHLADASGATIATVVNHANHPETLGSRNHLLTSDFPHFLRAGIEQGVPGPDGPVAGLGGVAIFVNGAVGGMMTPLGATVRDVTGAEFRPASFEKARALGEGVALHALQALAGATPESAPQLAMYTLGIEIPVENWAYQAMFRAGLFERTLFGYDEDEPLDDDNLPWIASEVSLLELGPVSALAVPGELLPEYFLGGYDGSSTGPLQPLVSADNPNPPPLSQAPFGPFLIDQLPGAVPLILGLANDELGYFIPSYNYQLGTPPYLNEAEGDHYEETNSVGPAGAPIVIEAAERLISWRAEN